MKNKIIALLCTVTMLFSVFSVMTFAAAANVTWVNTHHEGQVFIKELLSEKYNVTEGDLLYSYYYDRYFEEIIASEEYKAKQDAWVTQNFESGESITDQEYSFVFVGDTQYVTYNDAKNGTDNVKNVYKWIADNKETKKIAHVFALGDMTHESYGNDTDLSASQKNRTYMEEWNVVKAATDQLAAAGIPFSVVRGNHDDYQIDDVYGSDEYYMSQFTNDAFYVDSSHKNYDNSITNSWRTFEIHDDKYLFLTIDFNAGSGVLSWAEGIIASHPEYKVIVTTHSYLAADGSLQKAENDDQSYKSAITDSTVDGEMMWTQVFSKYANVLMICSGHVDGDILYSWRTGEKGNKVLQVLTNPQGLDKAYKSTGLVCVMNFSENGQKVEFEYYSPLLDSYKKGTSSTVRLDDKMTEYSGSIDMMSIAESCGRDNWHLDNAISNAPELDGSIGTGEYSVSRLIPTSEITPGANLSGIVDSDVTEAMAYDENYIYYALSFKQTELREINVQLTPKTVYKDVADFYSTHNKNFAFRVKYDSTNGIFEPLSIYAWKNLDNLSSPTWDHDIDFGASYNADTAVYTYEFKINRDFFKNNNFDDSKIGYMLYFGTDSEGTEIWYRWHSPDIQSPAEISSAWSYNYVSIGALLETKETASVRISTEETGLRFKTIVDKNILNGLIEKYGSSNVSIGTLIAPADKLGSNNLTHNFGTVNVDYIDVLATVNDPFESNTSTNTYAGSITSIKTANLDRDFVGVGYIKITKAGTEPLYYYSDSMCTRNVSAVASAAYADVEESESGEYRYKITSLESYNGKYSPYKDVHRDILKKLIRNEGVKDSFEYDIFDID